MSEFIFKNEPTNGFHGWLNTNSKEIVFCGRLAHFDILEAGELEGIEKEATFNAGISSWSKIRTWAASKGWVHFVTHDDDNLWFYVGNKGQQKVCKAFAVECFTKAVWNGPQET